MTRWWKACPAKCPFAISKRETSFSVKVHDKSESQAEYFYIVFQGKVGLWKRILEQDYLNELPSEKLFEQYYDQINQDLEK